MSEKSDRNIDGAAKCPFYKKAVPGKNPKISCEGTCEWSVVQQVFQTNKEFSEYADHYCCQNYQQCMINRMLDTFKYGEIKNK